MSLKNIRTKLLVALVLLFALHLIFISVRLYGLVLWLDTPMHIVGAFLATGFVLSFVEHCKKTLFFVLGIALLIGVTWEFFELISGITYLYSPRYISDTLGDLCSDIVGGVVTYSYIIFYLSWHKN